ncbi:MAG: PAS domain-containing sensor histidine kinase [Rhodospirillales bacterium]|nr:PAS domain-containing sensor histidine kinase [Rhodospirillales bacterium]
MRSHRTSKLALASFRRWSREASLSRRLALGLALAAVASGLATLASMAIPSADTEVVLFLLYLDILFGLPLGAVVALRLARLWSERRRGQAGSGLHARLVVLFGLVAVTPAILVAVFAGLFLNFGLESWFSERVRTAVDASQTVAESYLKEHKLGIVSEISAMANDLNRNAAALMRSTYRFENTLSTQAALRSLPEAAVIDSQGRFLARSRLSLSLEFDRTPTAALEKAQTGEIVVLTSEKDDRVRAIVKLNRFVDAFLMVGRYVDPEVIEQTERAQGAVSQYKRLEKHRESIQISFVLIFVVVALLLLLAAVWIGLNLATQLARPISNLISASERIRKGDLGVRVVTSGTTDEIGALGRSFNRMTRQLESQQRGLMEANRELDERRQFTETVLTGVTSGVIGLDGDQKVTLPNRAAADLLSADLHDAIGADAAKIFPEISELLKDARERPERLHQAEVQVVRRHHSRTLLVRVAAERLETEVVGYVVTFDDITELLSAQRKAAWADIARRIAHEIKNPLTPIRLSAERLKRKYLKEVKTDPEVFAMCTETIVRQVEDIGRMVDDFSSFARMPQPSMKSENLVEICRQAIFLEKTRHSDVTFDVNLPDGNIALRCDGRQVGRALANILKNAAESVEGRDAGKGELEPGCVALTLREEKAAEGGRTIIEVTDNGIGLPREYRDRLTEPYVTTRDKGTGLGLAIVMKIMEDHSGDLVLEDGEAAGATVSLIFNSRTLEETGEIEGDAEEGAKAPDAAESETDVAVHGS